MKCQLYREGGTNRRGALILIDAMDLAAVDIGPGDTLNVYLHKDKESLEYIKGAADFGALTTYTASKMGRRIRFVVYPRWVKKYYGVWMPGLVQFVEADLTKGRIVLRKVGK